jgi:hypothetical protein
VAFGAALLLGAAAALALPAYRTLLSVSLAARPLGVNLLTQAHAVGWLAAQAVRPGAGNADPGLPVVTQWDAAGVLLAGAVVGCAVVGLALLRSRPAIAFGLLWPLVWLAPTSSVLPRLDVVNERQAYLALVGPAWLLGLLLAGMGAAVTRRLPHVATPERARAALLMLAVACMLALGVATVQRNRVYADEITFWRDVVEKSPLNARAAGNLAYALALACRDDEALAMLNRAIELDPDAVRPRVNRRLLGERALPRTCGGD